MLCQTSAFTQNPRRLVLKFIKDHPIRTRINISNVDHDLKKMQFTIYFMFEEGLKDFAQVGLTNFKYAELIIRRALA